MGAHFLLSLQQLCELPAQLLLSSLWQGVVLAACAACAITALPKATPSTRFTLWGVVFALVAALPLLNGLSIFLPSVPAVAQTQNHVILRLAPVWAIALCVLWAACSLFSAAKFVLEIATLQKLRTSSTAPDLREINPDLKSLLGRVTIRLSAEIDVPGVLGFFHPVILFPQWLWQKLTPGEMKQIVLHELAHLRRKDDWTGLLCSVLRILLPWNPALLWIERQLRLERERACDDAVLGDTTNPREYALCLTRIAEARLDRRRLSLAPGAWERRTELTRRVYRILEPARDLSLRPRAGLVAASLAAALFGGLVLAASPHLVSFAPARPNAAALAGIAEVPVDSARPFVSPGHLVPASLSLPNRLADQANPTLRPQPAVLRRHSPVRRQSASHLSALEKSAPMPSATLPNATLIEELDISNDGAGFTRAWIVFTSIHSLSSFAQAHPSGKWIVFTI